MGFYPQPNSWICGPFALKHALAVWGRFVREWDLARVAGSNCSGTDEQELGRAAASLGFDLGMERFHEAEAARHALVAHLTAGVPTLLCIEQWDHWVTAVATEDDEFVLFDSRFPSVVRVLEREALLAKWCYRDAEIQDLDLYDLHPLAPRLPTRVRASFTLERARELMRFENLELTRRWAELTSCLVELGAVSSGGEPDLFSVSLPDYLRAWQRGQPRAGIASPKVMARAIDQLVFVAATYDFVLSIVDADRTERQLNAIVRRTVRMRELAATDRVAAAHR